MSQLPVFLMSARPNSVWQRSERSHLGRAEWPTNAPPRPPLKPNPLLTKPAALRPTNYGGDILLGAMNVLFPLQGLAWQIGGTGSGLSKPSTKSCFGAGTPLLTPAGARPIESI